MCAAFEEKQMRLKALRNRQDLFQEEVRDTNFFNILVFIALIN